MGSPLDHRAWLCSLHSGKCHKVSAQVREHCLQEGPENQILAWLKPFTSSKATPEEAMSLVLSSMAATSLPQLWSRGHVGLHLMKSALKLNSFPCTAHKQNQKPGQTLRSSVSSVLFHLLYFYVLHFTAKPSTTQKEKKDVKNPGEEKTRAKIPNSLKQMGKFSCHSVCGRGFHTRYSLIYHASPINIR